MNIIDCCTYQFAPEIKRLIHKLIYLPSRCRKTSNSTKKGFIKTGNFVENFDTKTRPPFYLETSRAGIFAADDARCH